MFHVLINNTQHSTALKANGLIIPSSVHYESWRLVNERVMSFQLTTLFVN